MRSPRYWRATLGASQAIVCCSSAREHHGIIAVRLLTNNTSQHASHSPFEAEGQWGKGTAVGPAVLIATASGTGIGQAASTVRAAGAETATAAAPAVNHTAAQAIEAAAGIGEAAADPGNGHQSMAAAAAADAAASAAAAASATGGARTARAEAGIAAGTMATGTGTAAISGSTGSRALPAASAMVTLQQGTVCSMQHHRDLHGRASMPTPSSTTQASGTAASSYRRRCRRRCRCATARHSSTIQHSSAGAPADGALKPSMQWLQWQRQLRFQEIHVCMQLTHCCRRRRYRRSAMQTRVGRQTAAAAQNTCRWPRCRGHQQSRPLPRRHMIR